MRAARRKVAVIGAGVIGQVYAGRLAAAGHNVWLLARGQALQRLAYGGVCLCRADGAVLRPAVTVVGAAAEIPAIDVAYLAVRGEQVAQALPLLAAVDASAVVTLANLGAQAADTVHRIGPERAVLGFPGVGGVWSDAGVQYHEIPQQATMVGAVGGRHGVVAEDLARAGFAVATEPDPVSWLATHAVFIVAVGAAIIAAGGSEALGRERARTADMVFSVRDGFAALARAGVAVRPMALRTIFSVVPSVFSVPYWQRQLRGPLGRLALAPHVLATRDSEFPFLVRQARMLVGHAPRFDAAMAAAGYSRDGADQGR